MIEIHYDPGTRGNVIPIADDAVLGRLLALKVLAYNRSGSILPTETAVRDTLRSSCMVGVVKSPDILALDADSAK